MFYIFDLYNLYRSFLVRDILPRALAAVGAAGMFSSFLLLICFPVAILTAIAIKLESPGSVFFRQERVGLGNKCFILWKFRSMYQNAEENGAVWAEKNDSRITRAG